MSFTFPKDADMKVNNQLLVRDSHNPFDEHPTLRVQCFAELPESLYGPPIRMMLGGGDDLSRPSCPGTKPPKSENSQGWWQGG